MIRRESESSLHWNYFIALESDVLRLARYVELTENNYGAYSIEMVRIYLAACSEVDVVAKLLCRVANPGGRPGSIDAYRKILRGQFSEIESAIVRIPRYGLSLRPWSNWKKNETPRWWSEHQKVKHQRANNYHLGNLQNALNAVAALFVITILYYCKNTEEILLRPTPRLFNSEQQLAYICAIMGDDMALVVPGRQTQQIN